MNALYQSYLDLLTQLGGHLQQLTQLAQKKIEAVRRDDLLALDEVLKREQAMTLTLRGLEQKRLTMVSQLGLEGVSLADLPQRCPEQLEIQAREAAGSLHRSYQVYRDAAQAARNTLECNLHEIEKIIAASGVDPADMGAGYEAPGSEPPKNMKTDFRA